MSCYAWINGQLVTTHPHFEARCVTDAETDLLYAARLAAYHAGGWAAWEAVKAQQITEELVRVTWDGDPKP